MASNKLNKSIKNTMKFRIILNFLISFLASLSITLIIVLLSQQISNGLKIISPEQGIGYWISKIIYYGKDIILFAFGLFGIILIVGIISGKMLNIKYHVKPKKWINNVLNNRD